MPGRCAGERAFFMTKKFRLDQFRRHSCTIQRDERVPLPGGFFMDGACDKLLACAGLAENANTRLACRNAVNLLEQLFHRRAGADEFVLPQALPRSEEHTSELQS